MEDKEILVRSEIQRGSAYVEGHNCWNIQEHNLSKVVDRIIKIFNKPQKPRFSVSLVYKNDTKISLNVSIIDDALNENEALGKAISNFNADNLILIQHLVVEID